MYERAFEVVMAVLSVGNLTQNSERISGADIVGALGLCDPLGAAMFRVYALHDPASAREAARLLVERVRPQQDSFDRALYIRIASLCVVESAHPECSHCHGTGSRLDEAGVKRVCGACHGSGILPLSPKQRASLLGIRLKEYWPVASVFRDCAERIRDAEISAGQMMSYQISGRGPKPRW